MPNGIGNTTSQQEQNGPAKQGRHQIYKITKQTQTSKKLLL